MNAFPAAIAAALMLASFAAFGADPKGKVAAPTPSPVAVDAKGAADLKRAQQIVATRCSLCHGLEAQTRAEDRRATAEGPDNTSIPAAPTARRQDFVHDGITIPPLSECRLHYAAWRRRST